MSTPSDTHETSASGPAGEFEERGGAPAPRTTGHDRHPFSVLPDGWAVIGRCRFGTGVPGPHATGCYALAHPEIGVALIDIAPYATPNAEARLRRALTAAEFWPDFPGTLPVLHDRVEATALRGLPWLLNRSFAALPALTVPGGAAWIEGVQRAMAADPAWELPGQPKAAQDASFASADDAEPGTAAGAPRRNRPRRWGRLAALPAAFVATFAVGVVSGILLLDSPAPSSAPSVVAALPPQGPATPAPAERAPRASDAATNVATGPSVSAAAVEPSRPAAAPAVPGASVESSRPGAASAISMAAIEPSRPAAAEAAAPQARTSPVEPSHPAAEGAPPPTAPALADAPAAAPPAPQPALTAADDRSPVGAPVTLQAAGPLEASGPAAPSPLETRVALATPLEERALPMAPPRAPARTPAPAPVRVSAPQQSPRPAPVIDRACSQALFRFQQGERLTAAEQNFIRTGCSTARR